MSLIYLIYLILLPSLASTSGAQSTCDQDVLDKTFVTQCGPSICEPLLERNKDGKRLEEWPDTRDQVAHVVSSRGGHRFKVFTYKAIDTSEYYYEESHGNISAFVDTETKYQRILGFGSTLTDASCKNIDDLPDNIRDQLIKDYFSIDAGIGLNLIKVPIGSSKYSYTNYVLDEPDAHHVELSAYDTDNRIPIIRDALSAAGKLRNRFKILASSATAPPQYKNNNKIIHGGLLKPSKIADYASYLTGFISAYKAQGLNIWSLILNESPVTIARDKSANDSLDYNSMAMRPSDTVRLVEAIETKRSKDTSSDRFRILLLGDNRAYIPVWADSMFKVPEIERKVTGIAYHCDNERFASYDNLAYSIRRYPLKYLLASQGSVNTPIKLGNWQYAENYATEIVKNLEFGSVGWIDFNMALNLEGGPYINEKFKADASVMVNARKGTFYRNPMMYAIGHFSRYVKPGSIHVKLNFHSSAHMYSEQHIAFLTPDNYVVVIVINNNIGPMPMNIGINKRTRVEVTLDTKSFNTFIFRM